MSPSVCPFQNQISPCLVPIWQFMIAYDSLWQHMTTYDNCRQLLTAYDNLWQLITAYHSFWQLLTAYDSFWQLFKCLYLKPYTHSTLVSNESSCSLLSRYVPEYEIWPWIVRDMQENVTVTKMLQCCYSKKINFWLFHFKCDFLNHLCTFFLCSYESWESVDFKNCPYFDILELPNQSYEPLKTNRHVL